jgi:sialic acid synthase SpsE
VGIAAALPIKKGVPMHVVAKYPAPSGMLERMHRLRAALRRPVGGLGYSDHTVGIYWAVRMATHPQVRACVVEKHFTLAHDFGPLRDHRLSATPEEMKEMIERIKS